MRTDCGQRGFCAGSTGCWRTSGQEGTETGDLQDVALCTYLYLRLGSECLAETLLVSELHQVKPKTLEV